MRVFVVAAVVAALAGVPSVASANGGAYFSLDKTYYLVGDNAVATSYVSIPKSKAVLLDRGPFYAFVVPDGATLREGAPIPPGALRVGTFTVTYENDSYEFEVRFTMPSLPPGWNTLRLCNDPCTISGFREPLYGSFNIVKTAREASLLKENGNLRGQLTGAKRETRKVERTLAAVQEVLRGAESDAAAEISALQEQVHRAQAEAASAQEKSVTSRRVTMASVAALIALGAAAIVARFGRRSRLATAVPKEEPIRPTSSLEDELARK
jgi:hypothetical protein